MSEKRWVVTPKSTDPDDIQVARLAEKLLEHRSDEIIPYMQEEISRAWRLHFGYGEPMATPEQIAERVMKRSKEALA
jgi:cyclopropane fatty-acyl-phospholipid synthase-like methyltransferase